MRKMTAEVRVTRALLTLPDLVFGAGTVNPEISVARNGWGPGDASFRRITAESPYFEGRTLVRAVRDTETGILKVRFDQGVQQKLYQDMNNVIAALTQPTYTLDMNVNGNHWRYVCEAADFSIGDSGAIDDLMLRSNIQYVGFSIPHKPTSTLGWVGDGAYPVIE